MNLLREFQIPPVLYNPVNNMVRLVIQQFQSKKKTQKRRQNQPWSLEHDMVLNYMRAEFLILEK